MSNDTHIRSHPHHTYRSSHLCCGIWALGTLQERKNRKWPYVPSPCVYLWSFFSLHFSYIKIIIQQETPTKSPLSWETQVKVFSNLAFIQHKYIFSLKKKKNSNCVCSLLFLCVYPFITWNICVHLPLVCFAAAHQCILDKATSAAMDPKAIMEGPTTAELAASQRVRNPSTAAVTQPHWDPSPRVVWTAVFIYKDKDGWRKHLIRERAHFKQKPENQAERWESFGNLLDFTRT